MLRSEFLFRVEAEVGEVESAGEIGKGERRVVGISGGRFSGSGLRGRILPGGADWQLVRGDGITEIEARYVLECDGGERVVVSSSGLRHGPAEVMARLARGEAVDPAQYYFRTALRFEAGAPAVAWLNGVIAVALGRRLARAVELEMWRIL